MSLVWLSFTWVAGILLGSKIDLPPLYILPAFIPLTFLFFSRRHKKIIILATIYLVCFIGGDVYYQLRATSVDVTDSIPGWIESLRLKISHVLAEVLPEPQASLAQGILLGIRENIPQSVQSDFSRTGTTHILAISGQNLSIVAGMLVGFGIWIWGRRRYYYVWLALGVIWLYSLMTGMQPPVVRGAIMASIYLAADLLGRQHDAFAALSLAGAVMIGIRLGVLNDASFQMSFMAMTGLIFIYPMLRAAGNKVITRRLGETGKAVPVANIISDSLSVSFGATLAVWPLIAFYFGNISWAGPVATLFGVPVLPGIIIAGMLTGIVGLVALPVAQVVGWVAWLFISYLLGVVKLFSFVPYSTGLHISPVIIFGYYAIMALFIWVAYNRSVKRKFMDWTSMSLAWMSGVFSKLPLKWVTAGLSVLAVLVWASVVSLPDARFHAAFLNVGQGDAVLFQQGGRQILVDGGPSSQNITLALGREMPFWDRTIDLVILTHPHTDHLTGLLEVTKRYKVQHVIYPDENDGSPLYADWLGLLKEKGIETIIAKAGERVTFGSGAVVEVLNPVQPALTGTQSDIDNNGVVLKVEIGKVSFLITGDMMWEGESELVSSRADLASTVLKVAHHGSTTSSSSSFLNVVSPDVAVISVGKDNPYGHPNAEIVDRLAKDVGADNIYRTDVNGTIDFTTDGEKLWVKTKK